MTNVPNAVSVETSTRYFAAPAERFQVAVNPVALTLSAGVATGTSGGITSYRGRRQTAERGEHTNRLVPPRARDTV